MSFFALPSVASRDEAATGDEVRRSECWDVAAVKYSECCLLFDCHSSSPSACLCVACTCLHHLTTTARSLNMAFSIYECLAALAGNMNASYSVRTEKFLELELAVYH